MTTTIRWERTNFLTRHCCCFCGNSTEKDSIVAVAYDENGEKSGFACHGFEGACIESGPDKARAAMIRYAEDLEAIAALLRKESVGVLQWPNPEEYRRLRNEEEEDYLERE